MPDLHAARLAQINALYDATGRADWATAARELTEDFFITEADGLPFAGVYSGKTALQTLYQKVMAMMDVAALDIVETTVGETHAVTLVDFVFAAPEGQRARVAEMFRFRGDKICEIRPYYFDPAPVHAAVRAKLETGQSREGVA